MFLKKIDIYGSKPGFTLNNQNSYNTTLGGVFTFLTLFIYIFLFMFLSKDFFLKKNPTVSHEKVFYRHSDLNNFSLNNDTFLIGFIYSVKDPKVYKLSCNYVKIDIDKINYTKVEFNNIGILNNLCLLIKL